MLEQYLASPREKIIYEFGISLRYVLTLIGLSAISLGSFSYFFQINGADIFFQRAPLVILMVITVVVVARFLSTAYFVSDDKIYKKIGIGFTKVTSAKHTEIDDMIVQQGFIERFLFGTGKLCFNTPGSNQFEIVLPYTDKPYDKKREIYQAWQK